MEDVYSQRFMSSIICNRKYCLLPLSSSITLIHTVHISSRSICRKQIINNLLQNQFSESSRWFSM